MNGGQPISEVAAGDWLIRRGNQEFRAPDAETVKAWHSQGRVAGSDYIWHPSLGSDWQTVRDFLAKTGNHTSEPEPRRSNKKLWLIPVAACAVVLAFIGPMVLATLLKVAWQAPRAGDEERFATLFEARLTERLDAAFPVRSGYWTQSVNMQKHRDKSRASRKRMGREVAGGLSGDELRQALSDPDHALIESKVDERFQEMLREIEAEKRRLTGRY